MNSIDRCLSELSSVALLLIITSAVATALAGVRALRLGRIRRLLRGRVRSLSAISRLVIRLGISDLGTVITVRSMSVLLRRVLSNSGDSQDRGDGEFHFDIGFKLFS